MGARKVEGRPWPLCPPSVIHGCSTDLEDSALLTGEPSPPTAPHTWPVHCLSPSHLPQPPLSFHPAQACHLPAPVHLPTPTICPLSNLAKRRTASTITPLQVPPHGSAEHPSTWYAALQPLRPQGIRCPSTDASGAMSSVLLCTGPLYEPVCFLPAELGWSLGSPLPSVII